MVALHHLLIKKTDLRTGFLFHFAAQDKLCVLTTHFSTVCVCVKEAWKKVLFQKYWGVFPFFVYQTCLQIKRKCG